MIKTFIILLFIIILPLYAQEAKREVQLDSKEVYTDYAVIMVKTIEFSETVTVWKPKPNQGWNLVLERLFENAGWHKIQVPVKKGWNSITVCMEGGVEESLRIFRY